MNRLIRDSFTMIIFCMGALLFISYTNRYQELLRAARDHGKDPVMIQQFMDHEEMILSYAQLIASLCYPQDYDIRIDDVRISKLEHNVAEIKNYEIREISYKKRYQYDSNGNITYIIYQGIIN